jgi:hypothetical protein
MSIFRGWGWFRPTVVVTVDKDKRIAELERENRILREIIVERMPAKNKGFKFETDENGNVKSVIIR